jgi:hypothetical protein
MLEKTDGHQGPPQYDGGNYGFPYKKGGYGELGSQGTERSELSTGNAMEMRRMQRYEMNAKRDTNVVVGELDGRAVGR